MSAICTAFLRCHPLRLTVADSGRSRAAFLKSKLRPVREAAAGKFVERPGGQVACRQSEELIGLRVALPGGEAHQLRIELAEIRPQRVVEAGQLVLGTVQQLRARQA